MTAYGRAVKGTPFGRWVVELSSVNRKMLDVNAQMAKECLRFELDVRKQIAELVFRGQVTARITHEVDEGPGSISLDALAALKKKWEAVAKKLGYNPKEAIDLSFLLAHMSEERSHLVENEKVQKALKGCVEAALQELVAMKEREGTNLAKDLIVRLKGIEQLIKKVEKLAPQMKENLRKKLQASVQGVFPLTKESEERFFRELTLFAEKSDVSEEITRLHSHVDQFRDLIVSKETSVGRTLDFLAQEMHREMNTIASKVSDSELSQITIAMRAECEKIREQVQNIE
ncbi:MAG: YicC/YloC family endoribonuclease [Chlamydiales bacterium]